MIGCSWIFHSKERRFLAFDFGDIIEKSLTVRFLGHSNGCIGIKEGKNTLTRISFTLIAVISL